MAIYMTNSTLPGYVIEAADLDVAGIYELSGWVVDDSKTAAFTPGAESAVTDVDGDRIPSAFAQSPASAEVKSPAVGGSNTPTKDES